MERDPGPDSQSPGWAGPSARFLLKGKDQGHVRGQVLGAGSRWFSVQGYGGVTSLQVRKSRPDHGGLAVGLGSLWPLRRVGAEPRAEQPHNQVCEHIHKHTPSPSPGN